MPMTRLRSRLRFNNTAAIHKLPNELLGEIMHLGFQRYKLEDHDHIDYLNTISAVCAIWRRVALDLPFLWTSVVYCSTHHRLKRSLDRMETYFARSKNLPLDVMLDFGEGKVNARRIMKVVSSHTGRFRFWRITIETQEISKTILPLRGPLDRLETLIVQLNFADLNGEEEQEQNARSSPGLELMVENVDPPLRELCVTGLAGCKLSNVPTQALIVVHINSICMSTVEMARILSRCQAAVNVNMVSLGDEETLNGIAPFALPSVETLTIVDNLPPTFPSLIDVASLRELTIVSSTFNPEIWASSPSPELPVPTWPNLHRLSLGGLWIVPDAIRPLLLANPSIKHIDMRDCREIISLALVLFIVKSPSGNEFVDASDTIVPVLEKLQIEQSTDQLDNGSLGKLILGVMTRRPILRVECDIESWEGSHLSWWRVREQTNSRFKLIPMRSTCMDLIIYQLLLKLTNDACSDFIV